MVGKAETVLQPFIENICWPMTLRLEEDSGPCPGCYTGRTVGGLVDLRGFQALLHPHSMQTTALLLCTSSAGPAVPGGTSPQAVPQGLGWGAGVLSPMSMLSHYLGIIPFITSAR